MPRRRKLSEEEQEQLRAEQDAMLYYHQREAEKEYQRRLNDPATIDEALNLIQELLDDHVEWSGVMVSRLHLEVMLREIRSNRLFIEAMRRDAKR